MARRCVSSPAMAWLGCAVSVAIILMKVVPSVPGSFTRPEWIAFAGWSARPAFGCWPSRLSINLRRPQTRRHSLRFALWHERLADEVVLRNPAENLDLIVDHGLGHAGDAVLPGQIGKFRRFHRVGRDVLVRERHFVCEADRPRTVRSSGCREHLDRRRRRDRGDQRLVRRGQLRFVAAGEQQRLDQRDELVAGRRAEKTDARVARLARRVLR